MTYRGTLVVDWSGRDHLAVVLVALTVAFLTGTTLVVVGVGAQTTALAGGYGANATVAYHDDPAAARDAAPAGAVVLPVATVETADGERVTVVGVPPNASERAPGELRIAAAPDEGLASPAVETRTERRFEGTVGSVEATVRPAPQDGLSATWYRADVATVERLGPTGAFVVAPADRGVGGGGGGTPVTGVLSFFLAGLEQLRTVVALVAGGAGVVAGITVYAVTTAAIAERRQTLGVLRATGASPERIAGLFVARGALLAGAGVAVGYAVGVVLANLAVNVGVYLGVPTSLSLRVTAEAAWLLLGSYLGVVLLACLASAAAVLRAIRPAPSALLGSATATRGRGLRLLDWRAVAPTAATLSVLVVCVVLVVSALGAAAPLFAAEGVTVTESGAAHPIASDVPEGYADGLRATGVAASPEILAFSVVDGRPFLTRGAEVDAFLNVSDAELRTGRRPTSADEALIGADLARQLGVAPGDAVTLGGSTQPGVARVTVVGTFAAPGGVDDQLLVSLPVARTLSGAAPGSVQFVRTDRVPEGGDGEVSVLAASVPGRVVGTGTVPVELTLLNAGDAERTVTVELVVDGRPVERSVTVGPGGRTTRTLSVPVDGTGTHEIRVAGRMTTVTVVDPASLVIDGLPDAAPPNSSPRVTVRRASGEAVANATVTVGDRTVRTDEDGRVAVPMGATGETTVTVSAGEQSVTRTVAVRSSATRTLVADLATAPAQPTVLDGVRATVTLRNPWAEPLTRRVEIRGGGSQTTRAVRVPPGETRTVAHDVGRLPAGEHTVTATVGEGTRAESTVRVGGSDRLASAVATRGTAGTTGLGRSVETVLGNLQVVVALLVALAGLTCAGTITVAFSQAVRRRRRTLGVHRATGASGRRVVRLVLGDALKLGTVATALALVAGTLAAAALSATGWLTFYGVRVGLSLSPALVAGLAVGSLALVLVGAGVATLSVVRTPPARLLVDRGGAREEGESA
jgi:ABC-type lipoprotein release transport system permease subunit